MSQSKKCGVLVDGAYLWTSWNATVEAKTPGDSITAEGFLDLMLPAIRKGLHLQDGDLSVKGFPPGIAKVVFVDGDNEKYMAQVRGVKDTRSMKIRREFHDDLRRRGVNLERCEFKRQSLTDDKGESHTGWVQKGGDVTIACKLISMYLEDPEELDSIILITGDADLAFAVKYVRNSLFQNCSRKNCASGHADRAKPIYIAGFKNHLALDLYDGSEAVNAVCNIDELEGFQQLVQDVTNKFTGKRLVASPSFVPDSYPSAPPPPQQPLAQIGTLGGIGPPATSGSIGTGGGAFRRPSPVETRERGGPHISSPPTHPGLGGPSGVLPGSAKANGVRKDPPGGKGGTGFPPPSSPLPPSLADPALDDTETGGWGGATAVGSAKGDPTDITSLFITGRTPSPADGQAPPSSQRRGRYFDGDSRFRSDAPSFVPQSSLGVLGLGGGGGGASGGLGEPAARPRTGSDTGPFLSSVPVSVPPPSYSPAPHAAEKAAPPSSRRGKRGNKGDKDKEGAKGGATGTPLKSARGGEGLEGDKVTSPLPSTSLQAVTPIAGSSSSGQNQNRLNASGREGEKEKERDPSRKSGSKKGPSPVKNHAGGGGATAPVDSNRNWGANPSPDLTLMLVDGSPKKDRKDIEEKNRREIAELMREGTKKRLPPPDDDKGLDIEEKVSEWPDTVDLAKKRLALPQLSNLPVTASHQLVKSEVDRLRLLVNSVRYPVSDTQAGGGQTPPEYQQYLNSLMRACHEDLAGMSVFIIFCETAEQRTMACVAFIEFDRRIIIAVNAPRHFKTAGRQLAAENLPPVVVSSNLSLEETKKAGEVVQETVHQVGVTDLDNLVTQSDRFLDLFLDGVGDDKALACLCCSPPLVVSNAFNRAAQVRLLGECRVILVRFAPSSAEEGQEEEENPW